MYQKGLFPPVPTQMTEPLTEGEDGVGEPWSFLTSPAAPSPTPLPTSFDGDFDMLLRVATVLLCSRSIRVWAAASSSCNLSFSSSEVFSLERTRATSDRRVAHYET